MRLGLQYPVPIEKPQPSVTSNRPRASSQTAEKPSPAHVLEIKRKIEWKKGKKLSLTLYNPGKNLKAKKKDDPFLGIEWTR